MNSSALSAIKTRSTSLSNDRKIREGTIKTYAQMLNEKNWMYKEAVGKPRRKMVNEPRVCDAAAKDATGEENHAALRRLKMKIL